MSESTSAMRMAYRDGGFFTLIWLAVSFVLRPGLSATYPPRGFVGLVSSLSLATDPRPYRLSSIALRALPFTLAGQRWRLTLGWEISPRRRRPAKSGQPSESRGARWSREDVGGGTSGPGRT